VLGFAGMREEAIESGVRRLAALLRPLSRRD
jgi:DNA-binding transcriptional MocR family regulator